MKPINKKWLLYVLIACVLAQGCAEAIEKDLSKKNVILVAPSNNITAPDSLALTFAWDSVDGATHYTLQVATPSFDSIVQLLADTPVYGTFINLPSFNVAGGYQWRVMAANNTSSTLFCTPWNFLIQ